MALSEAKKKSNKKWNDANMKIKYDRISILVPKGRKKAIEAFVKNSGESINGFTNRLYMTCMGLTEREWKEPEQE